MKQDEYLTPREMAKLLKISYHNALSFIRESGIPYLKLGRQYRVNRNQLDTYLQKQERK